jgi:hypothetical protein
MLAAIMAIHRFAHRAGDLTHALVFDHNPLTDRATLRIDGELVPMTLVRKAFGSVFRYRFALGDEALEVRVTPSSLRAFDVALVRADEPLAATRIGLPTIAATCGLAGAAGSVGMYLGGLTPMTPSLVIGAGTAAGATAILWLVYGRAR